ncbi:CDF family Co(II)/Ni(II) efflux transporter DmeF [Methyloversatilis thermotolerans]|uniref:CDF family Co(II)/Ni(II) efflux transporter DmeF n=1 Tax=Methyloversatilis thermotolerans TaxID=1346290 RepID=UPI00037F3D8E|nr:CDF family Co(II)/Ni(II) efflux transporter DmeF [Methyloversatilis thermotolerans]
MQPEGAERAVTRVFWISCIAMLVEIVTGYVSGSMALLADGWHMGTHVAAMAISAFAYRYMRAHAASAYYSFGPGKVSYLAAYSSSLLLAGASALMIFEAVTRLFEPRAIQYDEALLVAVLGLAVNLLSALLLHDHHHHAQGDHDHEDSHDDHHHDHNLRAAYLHVVADALTSIAAIAALMGGKWAGMDWMDPVVACVGGIVILRWAANLARDSSAVLLDRQMEGALTDRVMAKVAAWGGRTLDLHVWLLAPGRHALSLTVSAAPSDGDPEVLRAMLEADSALAHITVDVKRDQRTSAASHQSL